MTKKEYLKKLEELIFALPQEEKTEALEYYSNYFDDANDDDEVFKELGTPEELAKSILEKFACVPEKAKKEEENSSESEGNENFEKKFNNSNSESENLFYKFPKESVKNLGISIGVGNIVLKSGTDFIIETRGVLRDELRCEINQAGTLIIENKRKFLFKKLSTHDNKNYWTPRFLITIPEGVKIENTKFAIGAGNLNSKNLNFHSNRTMIDVSAGNFVVSGLNSNSSSIRCGMGNIEIKGILSGYSKIDCGMGNVAIKMPVENTNYSYDAKISIGSVVFNKEKRSGFAQNYYSEQKENHFSIKCGMGEVKILFENQ